jgi:integrase
LGAAATGEDPAFERKRPKLGDSFGEIFERFLKDHVDAKRKTRTAEEYRRIVKLHLLPRWSDRKLADLARSDVVKLHREMGDAPYAANRTIALLSKFFNWCEAQGIRPDHSNPCRHVEKYREDKRERFLSAEELARLGQVLDEEQSRARSLSWIVGAIRLLIFTGARLGEILTLRWDQVDFERSMLLLADSKTGKSRTHCMFGLLAPSHRRFRRARNSSQQVIS